jgi:hypothetical protein
MDKIDAVCWEDGCTETAVAERFEAFSTATFIVDGKDEIQEMVVLVCYEHTGGSL